MQGPVNLAGISGCDDSVERHALLARIRIDGKAEELLGESADVDGLAREGFRTVGPLRVEMHLACAMEAVTAELGIFGKIYTRHRFGDPCRDRLQRHHALLGDG